MIECLSGILSPISKDTCNPRYGENQKMDFIKSTFLFAHQDLFCFVLKPISHNSVIHISVFSVHAQSFVFVLFQCFCSGVPYKICVPYNLCSIQICVPYKIWCTFSGPQKSFLHVSSFSLPPYPENEYVIVHPNKHIVCNFL